MQYSADLSIRQVQLRSGSRYLNGTSIKPVQSKFTTSTVKKGGFIDKKKLKKKVRLPVAIIENMLYNIYVI